MTWIFHFASGSCDGDFACRTPCGRMAAVGGIGKGFALAAKSRTFFSTFYPGKEE